MFFSGASLCSEFLETHLPAFWIPAEKKIPLVSHQIQSKTMNIKNRNTGGRPKLSPAEKLKYRVAVNLCTKDFYVLKAKASQAGMNCTELARLAIIGCQIQQRLTPEQMDCICKLSGMGNNLNQIARKANAEGYTNARNEYLYLAEKIDNVVNTMENDSKNR